MKIKIGPVNYEIKKSTAAQIKRFGSDGEDVIGYCDSKKLSISILEKMPSEMDLLVLTHEIIHAVANVYGIESLQTSESAIHSLGVGIVNLLKDNSWFTRKFLVKK